MKKILRSNIGPASFMTENEVVLHGDLLEVLPGFKKPVFDAIVTDPPYASGGRSQVGSRDTISKIGNIPDNQWFLGDNLGVDTYGRWMRWVALECLRVTSLGGHGYVFTDWRQYSNLTYTWESVGWTLKNLIVWDKNKGGSMGSFWRGNHEFIAVFAKGKARPPAHRKCYNTWTGSKPQRQPHPTVKPLGLMEYIISAIPKVSGWLLDPFAGSGTTLLAARNNGFQAVGIERHEPYLKICKEKLSE